MNFYKMKCVSEARVEVSDFVVIDCTYLKTAHN